MKLLNKKSTEIIFSEKLKYFFLLLSNLLFTFGFVFLIKYRLHLTLKLSPSPFTVLLSLLCTLLYETYLSLLGLFVTGSVGV